MATSMERLRELLDKATNPNNKFEDWEYVVQFCDRVNEEDDGPLRSLTLVVPKMQSTNEAEAILALTVLEACVKNCGKRFHQELGKFRFLNEIIRMVSPKYLGNQTPVSVKEKVLHLLGGWKDGLPEETKIQECYDMLRSCGLVANEDASTPEKPKVQLKMEKHKEDLLGRLLQSTNPDDLRAANRMIREAVRKDEKRMEKLQKRLNELEEVKVNIKVLNDMLSSYSSSTSESDKQLMSEIYQKCEDMKPRLFRMAGQITATDEGMSDVLKTNDDLLRVTDLYANVVGTAPKASTNSTTSATPPTVSHAPQTIPQEGTPGTPSVDDLLINLDDLTIGGGSSDQSVPSSQSLISDLGLLDFPISTGTGSTGLELGSGHSTLPTLPTPPPSGDLLADLGLTSSFGGAPLVTPSLHQEGLPLSLDSVNVPFDTLQLKEDIQPLQVFNKNGLTVTFHFTKNFPAPYTHAVIVSMLNTGPAPFSEVEFQAAVPKSMKVKLQSPSGKELPAFNPIAAPIPIRQVMLLQNTAQTKTRLKFRLKYIQNNQEVVETGEASDIPF